jgi:tetratricopeptide (TPR) repeat protein
MEDYSGQLEGEERLIFETFRSYAILEQKNDSKPYYETIQYYLGKELSPREQYIIKLYQSVYLGYLKAKIKEALAVIDDSDEIYNSLNDQDKQDLIWFKAWSYHLKGSYYMDINHDLAQEILEKGVEIFDNNPNMPGQALKTALLLHIGNLHLWYTGKYDIALKSYEEGLALGKKLTNNFIIPLHLSCTAEVHLFRGEVQKALELNDQAIKLSEKYRLSRIIGELIGQRGRLLFHLRDYKSALKCFKEALVEAKKLGLTLFEATTLYHLLVLLHRINDENLEKKVTKYLKQLKDLAQNSSHSGVDALYKISQADHLKTKPRLKDKVKSQEIYQEISENENIAFYARVSALLNLCDLILFELKAVEDESLVHDLYKIFNKMTELTLDNPPIRVELLILESKLALSLGKGELAQEYLEKAMNIAQEKQMLNLEAKIKQETDIMNTQISKWKKLSSENITLGEKLEQLEVTDYLKQAIEITVTHSKT